MGSAPETLKVTKVDHETGKVEFQNVVTPCEVSPKDTPVVVGSELRGWLNLDGKFGPYFKVAEDRPQSASNGSSQAPRDDATGTSIEAQVAAKCAAELLTSQAPAETQSQAAERIHFLTATFYAAIQAAKQPEPAPVPDEAPPPF